MPGVELTSDDRGAINEYLVKKNLPLDRSVTFADVWIPEEYNTIRSRSEVWGSPEVSFRASLTADIYLNYPIFSANMMSVTGLDMALAMLREGGGYFLPQMLSLRDRLLMLERIKRADSAYIEEPLTIRLSETLREAREKMSHYGIWGLVVVNDAEMPVGMLSSRDWRYEKDDSLTVAGLMTTPVIYCREDSSPEAAKGLMRCNKIEKIPVVDSEGRLVGLYTAHGAFYEMRHPRSTRSTRGQFPLFGSVRIGREFTNETREEIELQIKLGARVMLFDTARAYAVNLEEPLTFTKREFPHVVNVAGNVSTAKGAKALISWGADIVKVNQGRGSQCLTSLQTGVGQPQVTAIAECAVMAERYGGKIVADGGMKSPGDVAKAFIAGAHFVMTGAMLAGTHESPAEVAMRLYDGKEFAVKKYEGSASFEAQKKRIVEGTLDELREPEGDWEYVPLMGSVKQKIQHLFNTGASSMTYHSARTLDELRKCGHFGDRLQSHAGYMEGTKSRT